MMNYISAAVLGIVEGLTEFLPISSTGHLIIFNHWFYFSPEFTKLFDVVIQSGAILAVIILFWKSLWPAKWDLNELKSKWGAILVAFVPTAIIGALFGSLAQEYLFTPWVVAAALIFYGIVFLLIERFGLKKSSNDSLPAYKDALVIGAAQSLALVPGTSRSGATMIALLLLGYARPAAARFSFLLAVPTLIAASAYSLLKYKAPISGSEFGYLAVGFVASFISAFIVSKWFIGYISKHTFKPFAWYRIVLGILVILFFGFLI